MGKTKIEWTEASWNPVRGCSIVSAGCANCYAMRLARRSDRPGGAYEGLTRKGSNGPTWSGDVRFVPEMLDYPLRLRQPHRIFVNSMSDLFHEKVTDAQIALIFGVMAVAPRHTFQILTKRAFRLRHFMTHNAASDVYAAACRLDETTADRWEWPLPNVWLGVSAEDQKAADERVPYLLETPAAVRWVSLEPLLGPIDLTRIDMGAWETTSIENVLRGEIVSDSDSEMAGSPSGSHIDWVVAGGESGFGSRPSHPDWFRSIRDQCATAPVPFFFKQWGSWAPHERDGVCPRCEAAALARKVFAYRCVNYRLHLFPKPDDLVVYRMGKKVAGYMLDGREHREYPSGKNLLATSAAPGA